MSNVQLYGSPTGGGIQELLWVCFEPGSGTTEGKNASNASVSLRAHTAMESVFHVKYVPPI